MARPSKLTTEQWQQVREAVVAGITYEQVAGEFGIPEATIRKRASWEKWPVPARIEKMAREHKEKRNLTVSHKGQKIAEKSTEMLAVSLAERGEQHVLRVFNATTSALERSLSTLPDPTNWKTAAIVDQMARRAAGLDRPESTSVSVNLAMFASTPSKSWRKVDETG